MGRTLRRVPLDFSWPLNKTWGGYINPYYSQCAKCEKCDGSGLSPQAKVFSEQWYGNAPFHPADYGANPLTVDHPGVQAYARRNVEGSPSFYAPGTVEGSANRETAIQSEAIRLWMHWRQQWCHHLIQADVDALVAEGRIKQIDGRNPTADEVNYGYLGGLGHDSINAGICLRARCERENVEIYCSACEGDGNVWTSKEAEEACENWTRSHPPTGDGYQLWETTTEGSPISPVFPTLKALCEYAARNCTTFGSHRATAKEWMEMLDEDNVHHREGNFVFI